jgi:two-component system sensor histidine kinase YesM
MKKWKKLSLRSQILIFFIIVIIFIVIAMGYTLFYSSSKIIMEDTLMTTKTSIEKSGSQIEMYMDKLKGLSELLSENPAVCRYLIKEKDINNSDRGDIYALIDSIIKTDKSIKSIIIIGSDGTIISNEKNLDMDFSGTVLEQTWYKDTLKSDMPVLTSARMQEFSMNKDNWVISIGREIKSIDGMHKGVVRIDLRYDAIEASLSDLNLGKSGFAFIINSNNEIVYHRDSSYFNNEEKTQELIDIIEMNDNELIKNNILTHITELKNTNWRLVGVAAPDSIIKMQNDIIIALWILGIILVFAAFGSSLIFTNSILKPLKQLQETMLRIKTGNMTDKILIGGSAEISVLSEHFSNMLRRIDTLLTEIKTKESSLRESELKVLHSQINPHFLYNTLDTIVWMAEMGDSDKIVEISKAMADFFRLSLRGGSELTTVYDELMHVKQYLIIQKERYQGKLSFEINYDEEIADFDIPKIILQPLAENSIYHGIRKLTGKGFIKINAKKEKDYIIITVEDNGIGFDTGKPYKKETSRKLGGIGLQNVDNRIHLYYGKGSGLEITSKPGKGTKVRIIIKTSIK